MSRKFVAMSVFLAGVVTLSGLGAASYQTLVSDNLATSADSDSPNITMTFINGSTHKIDLCVAYQDAELNSWVSEGFWSIPVGEERRIRLRTDNRNVYFHAECPSCGYHWSGDHLNWVADGLPFTIRSSDSYFPSFAAEYSKLNYDGSAGMKRKGFRAIEVPAGTTDYSYRLHD